MWHGQPSEDGQRAAIVPGGGSPAGSGHVAIGDDPDILADIHASYVNLAVWKRTVAPPLARAIASLAIARLGEVRVIATPDRVAGRLIEAAAPFVAGDGLALLAADAAALATRFVDLAPTDEIELRLERVTTDACRKYHADYMPLRLITTYRGRGTEWLPRSAAEALAAGAAPESLVPGRLGQGHVGLFKGRKGTSTPIVHRSPPIAGTGEDRLLLVINPAPEARAMA